MYPYQPIIDIAGDYRASNPYGQAQILEKVKSLMSRYEDKREGDTDLLKSYEKGSNYKLIIPPPLKKKIIK